MNDDPKSYTAQLATALSNYGMDRLAIERTIELPMAKVVELEIDATGKLWVNIDGKCLLRIGHVLDNALLSVNHGHFHTLQSDDESHSVIIAARLAVLTPVENAVPMQDTEE
jgi:hypothetical protein